MRNLWSDLKFAGRGIQKNPGFSLTVIVVLALGIGGNIAIFSIVNAVLLRPLPFADAERLTLLWGNVERTERERRGASFPDYADWRDLNKSFEGLASYWNQNFTLTAAEERVQIPAEVVGARYFSLLGVRPVLGREFLMEEETKPGSAPVVILGHDFWTERLGADPASVGATLALDGVQYTIVGVMPAGFRGLTDQASLFVPPAVLPNAQQGLSNRGSRFFVVLGRLRAGVTRSEAQAEMDSISRSLEQTYPRSNEKRAVEVASLTDETFGSVRPALLALLGGVGLVLLIACANVANLLLVRTEGRHAEIAIRTALGASRRSLLKLVLAESFLLAFIGAALGMLVAMWASDFIITSSPIQLPSFVNAGLDGRVLLFAVGLALVAGLLMGVTPALYAFPGNLHDTMKNASLKSTSGASRKHFRNALVIGEVAMTFVLLVGAGLFIQSFRKLSQVDPGFQPSGLLTMQVGLPRETTVNIAMLREQIASVPGVESVVVSSDIPYTGSSAIFYTAEGQSAVDATNVPRAYVHRVTPDFFRTLGIPLLDGRDFAASDSTDAVIVSEKVVKRFWPGQDGIGKRIKNGNAVSTQPWLNIVGVVGDTKTRGLPENPTGDPDLYYPFPPRALNAGVLIRTSGDPASLSQNVRNEILGLDKLALITDIATMEERMRPLTARSRFTSWLTGIFSAMALVLALIGIYGTMSYVVTERTREIGIRIAIGAAKSDVFRMVLGRGLALVVAGLSAGLLASLAAGRGIAGLLYNVSPAEPSVLIAVSGLMLVAGATAAYLPARRAVRIDPIRALRDE